jgi:hypothetical protein
MHIHYLFRLRCRSEICKKNFVIKYDQANRSNELRYLFLPLGAWNSDLRTFRLGPKFSLLICIIDTLLSAKQNDRVLRSTPLFETCNDYSHRLHYLQERIKPTEYYYVILSSRTQCTNYSYEQGFFMEINKDN